MTRVSSDIGLEDALRRALLAAEEARADVLHHAARAQAVADELRTHLAALSAEGEAEVEARLADRARVYREGFREAEAARATGLQLGDVGDKYALVADGGPPCAELIPLCRSRCCSFDFALSSQDLDEGVIAWDRARPYLIRHGADGACVHCDPETRACQAYHHRPAPCRTFDCRQDPRIWIDYEARILAPVGVDDPAEWSGSLNLLERVRRRDEALAAEVAALRGGPDGVARPR